MTTNKTRTKKKILFALLSRACSEGCALLADTAAEWAVANVGGIVAHFCFFLLMV
jgi:hypothetical protein